MNDLIDFHLTWLALPAAYVCYRAWKVATDLKAVNYIPGVRCIFEPFTFLGAITPPTWFNLGLNFQWTQRIDLYKRYGSDTVSIVPYLSGSARIWTANLEVGRQIISGGPASPWFKPAEYSRALLLWGQNVGGAEGGELWRRHRRIMGPAFNNKTYGLVWNETLRVYKDMVACEGWNTQAVIDVPVMQKITFKLAIFIIAACGFGLPFSWDEPPTGADGSMSLEESLRLVSDYNFSRTSAPKWWWKLPIPKIQHIDKAYQTLQAFMDTQLAIRRKEIRQEINELGSADSSRSDVFSRLVLANELDTEKLPLDAQELIGNTFVLLFAGHETTGHTLAATLGFLAIYKEEQDIVYDHIMEIVGKDRDPTVDDYQALYKVLSAFYEALRLMRSVMIRRTSKDTTLIVPDTVDKDTCRELSIPKGSIVNVDMIGIQHNPRYFPEPFEYRPSRWYEQETSDIPDVFTAFSIGPRACIGRKFATTEAVCWLTMLLREFQVEVTLLPGETRQAARERLMNAQMIMTLQIDPLPIRFVRRGIACH